MRGYVKKNWRKLLAAFFAALMVFQASSGAMDIAAKELGKVKLASTTGRYYHKDINSETDDLNEDTAESNDDVIKKEPVVETGTSDYDESLEVIEKRTDNSKTYKLSDGSYVTETYFEPIHKKEGSEFVEIDNTLENTSRNRSLPVYENKDGLYTFKVQDDVMSMVLEDGKTLSITNDSANMQVYSVKENVILYSEAYKNIDMEYRLHGDSVSTNFYINGETNIQEITYTLYKGNLKVREEHDALLFVDEQNKIVLSYSKPVLYDENGIAGNVDFTYTENGENIEVAIQFNTDWINSKERIYPLSLTTRAKDESTEINVDTAYNRSASPTITSNYYDLYVGYEDGSTTGGTPLGIARTYVHISNMNLGKDKEIVNAKLKLWKRAKYSKQWNKVAIGKTSGYIKPSNCTWNNKPSVTNISTTTVRDDAGWQEFDIKSYVQDIYKGKNNTIELKATNENSAYTPNVFSSESGTGLPKVTVQYKDAFDINPSLPVDTFDTEMRIFSVLNKGWEAFSFDGIARPDAQVIFDLVERGKDTVIKSETSKGNVNRYYIDPIYITNHIANTQTYKKGDVNYTTDYIYKDAIPKFDTPYEYKVKIKTSSSTSTKEFRTDSFVKYKVKAGDNLKNISSYYGVTIDQIKEDNNLNTNIVKEDDVLLVRFKKNNDKVSKDVYTPPVRTVEYKAKYVNRGPRCSNGVCKVIDPVNASTGNYYYQGADFKINDADEFVFTRYYNSTGPQFSNMFGNGFTTPIESYISYDKKGNILYFTGDGKIFEFEKSGTSYKSKPQDRMEIAYQNEKATIKDLNTETTYQFDAYGYLDKMITSEGTVTQINYDDYGAITSLKIGEKTVVITYNDDKLVKEMTLPSSKKVSYQYDDKRNLTVFTDTNGSIKKYGYDKNNYLISITDKNGNVITQNTYDNDGRVVKQIDGKGNVSTINYENKKTTITKANGSVEVYVFDDNYDTLSITQDGEVTSKYTYDQYRNITSMTDADGKVTTYAYNQKNLLKAQYPDGTYEEYKYDGNGHIIYQRDKEGNVTENTYTGNDLTSTKTAKNENVTYVYDDKRRIIKETDQFGASKSYTYIGNMIASITYTNGLVESFSYDSNGNTIKESDNQGKNITYVFNANNEMTQKNYSDGTNEQWTYDKNGNIISYKDRIGGVTHNAYDKNNNLISSTKGKITTTKSYDEINQLISETDEKGLTTSYTYDAKGNKLTETDAYGNVTSFAYDADDNIIKTTDSFGNSEINEYSNGNLMKTIAKDGQVTTYEYDSLNREIKKTNPNGTTETKEYHGLQLVKETDGKGTNIEHQYDTYNREIKTITTYKDGVTTSKETKYDIYGNVIETDEDGIITKNTYDVYKQLISTTDALGNVTKKSYDFDGNIIKETDALGNSVITQYDGNKNVISITDKNGNTETKKYSAEGLLLSETDALGFVKTYSYNDKGFLIGVIDPYKHKITYSYDKYGNQIEAVLEGKIIEKKEYDDHGREIFVQDTNERTRTTYDDFDRVIEKKNELTGLAMYTTYDAFGNVIEEKDSEGLKTVYAYDVFNRKIKTIDAYGRIEEIKYDLRDHVLETKAFDGTSTSSVYDEKGNVIESRDALGKVTKNTYDAMNRIIKTEAGNKVTETLYDANGQVVEVKNVNQKTSIKTIYDKNGNVIESIDALKNSTKTEFDAKNQVIATTDANGNKTAKEYDAYGNVIKEINPLGNAKQYQYDEFGQLIMEVDERGFETKYEYNDDFLMVKAIDAKGNEASVEYNDKNQIIKEIAPNEGVSEYAYDAYGREIKTVAPNGKETTKEYDVLGNVIKEVSGKKITVNTYDKLGRLTETKVNDVIQIQNTYNDLNQIIETKDANKNTSTYRYDENGNQIYADEKGSVSEKEYDTEGNIIRQIDNKTYITEHHYDANNKLLETKVNGSVTISKKYDANGNEIVSIENGVEQRTSYDANNRITKIKIPSASKEDEFVAVQSITYDESGNALKITDANGHTEEKKYDANNNVIEEINKNGIKMTYEYDGMNNLIKAQNHEERYVTYTYDKSNNITYKSLNDRIAEYKYDEDNHLISEEDEYDYVQRYSYDDLGRKTEWIKPDGKKITYTYDDLGNKLSEGDNTYTYDSRNNVVTAKNEEGTIKNTYDAFNNKTSVTDTKGNVVSYKFNADNKVEQKEYAGITVTYSYNENGKVDTIKKDGGPVAKYEYNNRNEVIKLTQDKTITDKAYDDMGKVLKQTSMKDGKTVYDASYTYDANDNMIEEVIDGKKNTYQYDAYDELKESSKYINDKLVKTTYAYDVFGNQIESSSTEGKKISKYNDKNQVESIETEEGKIQFSYDDNGNISKKINEDGRIDLYTYDELNQLTKLEQGQYVYEYAYDAEKERIQQIKTDTKDYHYDVWYEYTEKADVVGDSELQDTFDHLIDKVKKKEENNSFCTSQLNDTSVTHVQTDNGTHKSKQEKTIKKKDKYDVEYFKEPEVTDYTLDRNMEYTEVLASNDAVNVYGETLLQSDKEEIVTGWNDSVVAKINTDKVNKISYNDYGATEDIVAGHGYNSEMMDSTGLIYLRARYYDPSVSRFVQIDNNYDGEKESIASQNRYAYTMNNPYKYVDRNGNWSLFKAVGNFVNKVIKTVKKAVKKVVKTVNNNFIKPVKKVAKKVTKYVDKQVVEPARKKINKVITNVSKATDWVVSVYDGITGNSTSNNGGGSTKKKPSFKKVDVEAKCPSNPIKKLPITASHNITLFNKTYNFGIARVTFQKVVNTNIKMSNASAKQFSSIGLTDGGFNINFKLNLADIATLASNLGMSVGFGDWGAVKLSISSSLGNVSISLGARVETLKFWEDSSLTGSITSKIYNKDGATINVIDSATLKMNALAVATISVIFVKVGVPLISGIAAYMGSFLETFPIMLEGMKVVAMTA